MSHTPTPWTVDYGVVENDGVAAAPVILGDAHTSHWVDPIVARMEGCDNQKADAEFIVRACNAWNDPDALLARLHELSEADEARRYQRTPQQEEELDVMRSRAEL